MKKNSGPPGNDAFAEQHDAQWPLEEGTATTVSERNYTKPDAAQARRLHLAKQSRKRGHSSLTAFTAEKNRPIKLKAQATKNNSAEFVPRKQNLESLFEAEITTAPTLNKNKPNKDSLMDINFIGLSGRRGVKTYLLSFAAFLVLVGVLMFVGYQTWRHFIFTPVPSKAWGDKMGDARSTDEISMTNGVGEKLDGSGEKNPESDLPARGIKKYYQSANRFPQPSAEPSPTPRPSLTPTPTPTPRATTIPLVVTTSKSTETTVMPTTTPTTEPTTEPTTTPTTEPTTASSTTSTTSTTAPATEPTTVPTTGTTTESAPSPAMLPEITPDSVRDSNPDT